MDVEPPATEADVERALRARAAGPPSFGDDQPWDFALRWELELQRRVVWPVIARLLVDADPTIRTRALEYVNASSLDDAAAVARLLDVARAHPDAYPEPTVRDALAWTLANKSVAVRAERGAIAKAIVALLRGDPAPHGTSSLLAEYEPDALIASAPRWTEALEDQAAAVRAADAMAMVRRDHLLRLLRALSRRSVESRDEIARAVAEPLAIPAEPLRAILAIDGLPMPTTQPTLAECRRALDLP